VSREPGVYLIFVKTWIQGFPSLEQLHHLLAQYSSDATQHLYTKFGLVNAIGTNKLTQNLMLVKGTRVK
jgi:hypothetical protein